MAEYWQYTQSDEPMPDSVANRRNGHHPERELVNSASAR